MGITTRYAQNTEELERLAQALAQTTPSLTIEGEPGLQGEKGEPGEDGVDLTDLPIKYITASSGTVTLTATQSRRFRITLNGSITLKFSGFADGMKFSISVTQGSGGGNLITWPANIRWANGGAAPTLTTADDQRDTFGFERFKHGAEDSFDGFVIGQDI